MVSSTAPFSATVKPGDLRVDPMRKRDLKRVLEIERKVYPTPWTMNVFLSELSYKKERSYSVARIGTEVVGYSGVMYVLEDAHITNIAVDPAYHRHHVGSALMYSLVMEAIDAGSKNLTLEVRVSNQPAQRMYHSFGFMPVGVRKGYYQESNEDAIIMWAYDIDTTEYAARLERLAQERGLSARRGRRRWLP
ncbi:MAG: ribosomal protein S18-alanine N-acetyltransferase [Actinomycetota bacterium]|nr:ribosomal protein S18-alanine N-acetyltransferase [Actinomycetota bacterium]